MTIDEAIKREEEIAEENQRVVDTGIVFGDVTLDMLYCDDTEVLEEHLANFQKCADEHRQLAELLKELKQLREQTRWIPCSDRLPEEDGDYLLFGKVVEDDTECTFIGMYDACAEKFGYWEDYYDKTTLGFLDSELIEYNKVLAWMPLPAPYKSESEGK